MMGRPNPGTRVSAIAATAAGATSRPGSRPVFNVAAFQQVASGVFGNAGRNRFFGPGWVTYDMSLQRRIAVATRVGATLRWDVFNLFNRANFGNPDTDVRSASAGTIVALAGDARLMQFSIRLDF